MDLTLVCVCPFPMGSREFYDHIWALKRHFGHMTNMLDSDWLKNLLLRSDWLLPKGAILTPIVSGLLSYDDIFLTEGCREKHLALIIRDKIRHA